uniref:Secreted protein n=1 Tax=Kalanchoe fedtschenkoi TaxID=63787 RepID=A0A7N0VG58_KALFE
MMCLAPLTALMLGRSLLSKPTVNFFFSCYCLFRLIKVRLGYGWNQSSFCFTFSWQSQVILCLNPKFFYFDLTL